MDHIFPFAWHAFVIAFGGWSLIRGVQEYRAGSAKIAGWPRFDRETCASNYWLTITGRILAFVGAVALITLFWTWSR
jgi:hypothetical protein